MTRILDANGQELKVGDRVRSTGAETHFRRQRTGRIHAFHSGPPNVEVAWGHDRWVHAVDLMWRCPDLELLDPTEETARAVSDRSAA